jgi:hypothetical protein
LKTKSTEEMMAEIKEGITRRFQKTDEQRFYILLLSDVIAGDDKLKEQYAEYYRTIFKDTGDLFYYAFGFENKKLKKAVASILLMALDGYAIQQSLKCFPEDDMKMARIFIDFFSESIPAFLEKHKK